MIDRLQGAELLKDRQRFRAAPAFRCQRAPADQVSLRLQRPLIVDAVLDFLPRLIAESLMRPLRLPDPLEFFATLVPAKVPPADSARGRILTVRLRIDPVVEHVDVAREHLTQRLIAGRALGVVDACFDLPLLLVVVRPQFAIAKISAPLGQMVQGAPQLKRCDWRLGRLSAQHIRQLLLREIVIGIEVLCAQFCVEGIEHCFAIKRFAAIRLRQ